MSIQRAIPAGAIIVAAGLMAASCASDQTKTEKTTTEHNSTSEYQPPAGQSQRDQQAGQASAGSPAVNSQLAGSNGSTTSLDLNQTPIGKTQDQAAGSIGYEEQKQVVTTQTVNRDLPTVKQSTLKADINRMSASDFAALGIPKNVADNIVKNRDEHGGKFTSVDDLKQVPGMSTAWVDQNKDKLGVSTA